MSMLGKTVTVTVTNPTATVGSMRCGTVRGYHQKGGIPQSACLYGAGPSVRRFTGTVVATAAPEGGRELWIVSPRRLRPCEPELRRALPAEWNTATLNCHYEKSCGAVLFTECGGQRLYLLVRNRSGYYGFPKGHIEGTENEHETARREIREETGLGSVRFLSGFREVNRYLCRPHVQKQVVLFLARFDENAVICPAFEISEYRLLPYAEALRTVGHRNDKAILEQAEAFFCGASASDGFGS